MKSLVLGGIMALMVCSGLSAQTQLGVQGQMQDAETGQSGLQGDQPMTLPSPNRLVAMPLAERLALYKSIVQLSDPDRSANMAALRNEIDSLSAAQKQQMTVNFQSEFQALPQADQDKVRRDLEDYKRQEQNEEMQSR